MKKPLLFLVKLALFSLLFAFTAEWFDAVYKSILQLGVADTSTIPFSGSRMLSLFFALILATPGLQIKRKAGAILGAILLYVLIDRLMIPIWKVLPFTQKPGPVPAKDFYTQVYYMVMHWLLPVLLWLMLAFRQVEGLLGREEQKGSFS